MKKKVQKTVEEWLAFDDAIVNKVLRNKAIKVIREGEEPFITNVQEFILYTISDVVNRKIACIKIENGTILENTDKIEVDIDETIAEKYGL